MTDDDTPFVSVIIPVFNDSGRLSQCLAALAQQTYPAESYEVIVVDNGSDQPPDEVVARFARVRLLRQPKPGSYAARNMGIANTQADYLAFTDADCLVDRNWLVAGLARLRPLECFGLVAGRINLFCRNPQRPNWIELYDCATGLDQQANVRVKACNTANIFTHRSVFDRVGLFDEDLKSLGDAQWSRRVAAAGLPVVYGNEAFIDHPARSSLRDIIVKRRRTVGGEQDQINDKGELYRSRRLFRVLWRNFVPRLRSAWRQTNHPRLTTMAQRFKAAAVMVLLQYVDIYERIRMRLGGRAERR